MRLRERTRRRPTPIAVAGLVLACAAGAAFPAGAQTLTQEVSVRMGGEVVNNPYLEEDSQGVSVAGTAEIRPRLSYDDSVTRFDLEAFARGSAYVDKYDFEDNFGGSANVSQRLSERLKLLMGGSVLSSESQSYSGLWPSAGGIAGPGEPSIPQVPGDVTVLGQRGRTTSISGRVGGEYTLDARSQLALNGSYRTIFLTQLGAEEYEVAELQGSYNRSIDERTGVGLVAGYRLFNYREAGLADARSASLLGSLSLLLGQAWTLEASAGVERTRLEGTPTAAASTRTAFTASGTLCRRDARERFCLDYSRQSQPTSYAGISNSDLLGLSYNRRLSEYDSITLGGTYSRNGGGSVSGLSVIPATTLYGVKASFDHRFSERLSGYVETAYDRLHRSDISIEPRARLGAGISYVFGRRG
jgi:hypothetical protein